MRRGASTAAGRAGVAALMGMIGLGASAPADLRTDLEAIGLALDRAVLQVSRPSRAAAPRSGARGYRLEGFGAMFVVAPRALPVPPAPPTPEEREIARAFSQAAQELEQRLPRVASDDVRLQLQQSLKVMRQAEADVRLREKMARRAAGDPVLPPADTFTPAPRTLEETLQDLERDVQTQLRLQAEALQAVQSDLPPEMRREIETHMRIVNQQANAFAAEAERARQEAERAIWSRLGQQSSRLPAPSSPSPSATDLPADTMPHSVLPPWHLWNEPMDDPTPDPQGLIRSVGAAVTAVLESQGSRLSVLLPQEVVAVAIDFVPATRLGSRARPARTLLVRARKADIDLRAAGQISPSEFRRRVEYVEY